MDFNLEIISEEGDNDPDPVFDSIINVMHSMKEATADKIYRKIQKEGETNYSKPQVDRALANALKYGIFEIKNNRYRVRDDILDDEDTVYWKLEKKREQTPFQIQDDVNERQTGPKLDPERDNQRFRKMSTKEKFNTECPHCGRIKRASEAEEKPNPKKPRNVRLPKSAESAKTPKSVKKKRKQSVNQLKNNYLNETNLAKKTEPKRKKQAESFNEDMNLNTRKINEAEINQETLEDQKYIKGTYKKEMTDLQSLAKYDSTDSEVDSIYSQSEDEQSFSSYGERNAMKFQKYKKPQFWPECDDIECENKNFIEAKGSHFTIESDSAMSEISSDNGSKRDVFFENLPGSSKHERNKDEIPRNQYLCASEMYYKQYGRGPLDQCERKPDWMGLSDEEQGTIIQSNNVLTIEPMDSLAFKSLEQASYIS